MHLPSRKRGGYVKARQNRGYLVDSQKSLGDLSRDPRRCHRIAPKAYQFCSFGDMAVIGDCAGELLEESQWAA